MRDTRERYGYRFTHQQVEVERSALRVGDYGVLDTDGELVAVVERRSLFDLAERAVDGRLALDLAELATLQRAAVVVEDRGAKVFTLEHVDGGFVADLLARHQVCYPAVPLVCSPAAASSPRSGRSGGWVRPGSSCSATSSSNHRDRSWRDGSCDATLSSATRAEGRA